MQTQQSLDARELRAQVVLQLSSTSDVFTINIVYTLDGAKFEMLSAE